MSAGRGHRSRRGGGLTPLALGVLGVLGAARSVGADTADAAPRDGEGGRVEVARARADRAGVTATAEADRKSVV